VWVFAGFFSTGFTRKTRRVGITLATLASNHQITQMTTSRDKFHYFGLNAAKSGQIWKSCQNFYHSRIWPVLQEMAGCRSAGAAVEIRFMPSPGNDHGPFCYRPLGTVENHGNTEITETVIFVKGRDFAKMPCFAVFFAEMPWF